MFGLLSLARDRAPSPLSVPIDCYERPLTRALACRALLRRAQRNNCAPPVAGAAKGFSMSISNQAQISKKKTQAPKAIPQVKVAPKPQPSGMSREELRQIVLEMIG